ncbi:PhzF family phenazine biosynthesis protein [Xiashengella succiniciproducens]|uniref:PhzF family phenazine biosynthesis protein n=1 Tax=Xiashengella succiniciproducens TaxID=2949635 RepID=A0A9J6ZS32_9BACT|nr:PhzF family phenazine biosynthesis protein [Alkaliflexus sp. Ai-910]URW80658.1 PhzF family phenazine biosynthesis protein [Alkaliflexus sp. Ai-910]
MPSPTAKIKGNPAAVCILDIWFTPTLEVDLCGHATLVAAYRLFELHRQASRN